MRSSVVLPAPLGPSSPVMPGMTSKVTSLTATTLPNQRETPSTRITAFARCASWRQPPVARTTASTPGSSVHAKYQPTSTPMPSCSRRRFLGDLADLAEDDVVHVHRDVREVEHRDPLSRRAVDLLREPDRERRRDHEQPDEEHRRIRARVVNEAVSIASVVAYAAIASAGNEKRGTSSQCFCR